MIKGEASTGDVHDLWDGVNKARSTSRSVTVYKTQLEALLLDYGKLRNELGPDFRAADET